MAIWLDEQDYADYFGIDIAEVPSDYTRLELLSVSLFSSIFPNIPQNVESDLSESCFAYYKYALAEQINWFNENEDVKDGVSSIVNSFNIGRYSENKGEQFTSDQLLKRLSTNAYSFLNQCGLTYTGLGNNCTINTNNMFGGF